MCQRLVCQKREFATKSLPVTFQDMKVKDPSSSMKFSYRYEAVILLKLFQIIIELFSKPGSYWLVEELLFLGTQIWVYYGREPALWDPRLISAIKLKTCIGCP